MRTLPLSGLLACLCLLACDVATPPPEAGADFNPMPQAAEYVFAKEFSLTTIMYTGFNCRATVHRYPMPMDSGEGVMRFIDSNSVHCTIRDYVYGTDPLIRDTVEIQASYLDTVAFRETVTHLIMTGAVGFLETALPGGYHRNYPDGVRVGMDLVGGDTLHLPKRDYPTYPNPGSPDAAKDCRYVDAEKSAPCRNLVNADFRYQGEWIASLQGSGFLAAASSFSSAPMGTGGSQSKIKLLCRIAGGDTLRFGGTLEGYNNGFSLGAGE